MAPSNLLTVTAVVAVTHAMQAEAPRPPLDLIQSNASHQDFEAPCHSTLPLHAQSLCLEISKRYLTLSPQRAFCPKS